MSLPQCLRDKIYGLLVVANIPGRSNIYLLFIGGLLFPNLNLPKGPIHLSLQQLAGYLEWPVQGYFCHAQGFAESLNLLSCHQYECAGQVLNDFLWFVGERLVLDLRNWQHPWEYNFNDLGDGWDCAVPLDVCFSL
jgi:hypothetical protein